MIQSNSLLKFSVDEVKIMNFEAKILIDIFKQIPTPGACDSGACVG